MGRVDVLPRVSAQSEANARPAFIVAGAMIGVASWLVIVRHPRLAGAAAGGATALLLYGSSVAAHTTDRLLRFLDSVADRAWQLYRDLR